MKNDMFEALNTDELFAVTGGDANRWKKMDEVRASGYTPSDEAHKKAISYTEGYISLVVSCVCPVAGVGLVVYDLVKICIS